MAITKLSTARAMRAPRPQRRGVGRPRGTGAQIVFEKLRERILSLELAPHADIDELDLVKEFKVSRTPVREALIRLSSEGLVELLPNKGPRVASLDANEVPQILEALELAQRTVNHWAAERRTEQHLRTMSECCAEFTKAMTVDDTRAMSETNKLFHIAIGRACGNALIESWYESLLNSSMRLARTAYEQGPLKSAAYKQYFAKVDAEHRAMVDAITRRDAAGAEQLGRQHAMLFRERVVHYLSESRADEITVSPPENI
ncbi:MAG: GntR family transcriptional regulator [Xanthobacteraceae bacterium]|nr:GntR family transcriptional regulator [Xanthobacteraceae bacterium]